MPASNDSKSEPRRWRSSVSSQKKESVSYSFKMCIVMDEEIKGMFKNCEDELAYLREVFRKY